MPRLIKRGTRHINDIIKEEDVIDDFSDSPPLGEAKNRFILAKYFIIGYLLLIGLAFVIKAFLPAKNLSEVFSLLEKIGYIVATIIGFYFNKK